MAEKFLDLAQFIVKQAPSTVYYIPNFVTASEEMELLNEVEKIRTDIDAVDHHASTLVKIVMHNQVYSAPKPKWTKLSGRRLQNWGGLPHPKGMIQEKLPPWLIKYAIYLGSLPVFHGKGPNHVLVNEYEPGQGIMPHEDGPLFHPVVSTISLGSHTLLDFYRHLDHVVSKGEEQNQPADHSEGSLEDRYFMSLLLEPRSLLLLTDDLYTSYLHGIDGRTYDTVHTKIVNRDVCGAGELGTTLTRSTRISLTIRHVPKTLKVKLKLGR